MRRQSERAPRAPEGAKGGLSRETPGRPAPARGAKVDPERFRSSMERLFQIYSDISEKADQVMQSRCPYKDARSRCTARFECHNQFFTKDPLEQPVCTGSDKLDYRSAWVNGGSGEGAH